nr:hypothetical protein [Tanacetum cinerariifolium]
MIKFISLTKRIHGHTRKQAVWNFEPGERFTVTFVRRQPVGNKANELTSFLGTLVKMSQHINISVTDWNIVKAISEKRKIVRSKSYEPHALGTKSMARLADEEKKKKGVLPTRGTLYIMSHTKKNGSIVNETAAKVIEELLNDASTSTSNTTNDVSTNISNTTIGPNIKLPRSKRSHVSQVPKLKDRIKELKVKMRDLTERQHIEMKEMKENQDAILQFMENVQNSKFKSGFFKCLEYYKYRVSNDSSSVHNPGRYGNSTSTRASKNKKSGYGSLGLSSPWRKYFVMAIRERGRERGRAREREREKEREMERRGSRKRKGRKREREKEREREGEGGREGGEGKASALQVLRRLESIFTSIYATDQKLRKAYKVYKTGKRLLYVKRNKATSLGKDTSKVGKEVQQFSLKDYTWPRSQRQKASDYDNSDLIPQLQNVSSLADAHVPLQQELDILFCPLYDEFFNAGSNPQDKQPTTTIQPTSVPSTPTYVHSEENNDNQAEEDHLPDNEFTNPFCVLAQEVAESFSHNIGNSNVPTFNQPQVFEYRWTKDHPLEQVCGNPSRPGQTR